MNSAKHPPFLGLIEVYAGGTLILARDVELNRFPDRDDGLIDFTDPKTGESFHARGDYVLRIKGLPTSRDFVSVRDSRQSVRIEVYSGGTQIFVCHARTGDWVEYANGLIAYKDPITGEGAHVRGAYVITWLPLENS